VSEESEIIDNERQNIQSAFKVITGRRRFMQIGAVLFGAPLIAGLAAKVQASERTASSMQVGKHALSDFDIKANDVQILFVDMQPELTQRSETIPPDAFEANAAVLAKVAQLLNIPITFSLVPLGGKTGAPIPGLVPYATAQNTFRRVVAGSFSDKEMVDSLASHKRKVLVISGYASEIAVLQSALGAIEAGYTVHIPVDAIGSPSRRTEPAVIDQLEMAGAIPTTVLALAGLLAPDFSKEPGSSVLSTFKDLRSSN
jgi:nicotinamidase-related amidase